MSVLKIFKSLGIVAIAIIIAQLVTVLPSNAQDGTVVPPGGGGYCVPAPGYICGFEGNYKVDYREVYD